MQLYKKAIESFLLLWWICNGGPLVSFEITIMNPNMNLKLNLKLNLKVKLK